MPMNSLEAREGDTDLMAELLAQRLLYVYLSEQVPTMVEEFADAGFSKGLLIRNKESLYRMVIVAAYDRTPFTRATGGYEHIWEIRRKGFGVPSLLSSVGLWSIEDVRNTPRNELTKKLSNLYLGGKSMDSAGYTRFDKTLDDTSSRITTDFQRQLILADSPDAIIDLFTYFTRIHGIGETIASKLVMYLLREIAIGRAKPADFPSRVTLPLIKEFHAGKAARRLKQISPNLVQKTAEILLQQGDAYAIDALFFFQRTRTSEFDDLVDDLRRISNSRPKTGVNSVKKELVKTMTFARCHDELGALMSNHRGKTFKAKDIRALFEEAYPNLDSSWTIPSDHCIDHTCKGACDCALTDKAIFSRPKRNTYIVL